MNLFSSLLVAACIFGISTAQVLKFSPPGKDALSYTFVGGHPNTTGGDSDIFIQILGPASNAWIALGQGGHMSGSQMFIIYANAANTNVTLSPRLGSGHNEPSAETNPDISLLAGSGIADGNITANILCRNCNTWKGGSMDLSGKNQQWIWAYNSGSQVKSDSISASIQQHDDGGYASFTLNMNDLKPSNSSNPFLEPIPAQSIDTKDAIAGYDGVGVPIHGVIMCLAFVVGFPVGAFLIRFKSFRGIGLLWIHVAIQMLSYLAAIIGLGIGVYIANKGAADISAAHPILGIIIVVILLFQPILGYVHHLYYKRYQITSTYTLAHVWYGRGIVAAGMINGLLGLLLAGQGVGLIIAYCIAVAAILGVWVMFVISAAKRQKAAKVRRNDVRMASLTYEDNEGSGRGEYNQI